MMTRECSEVEVARVQIEVLEQFENTLIIRWVEPGRCHYGEQRWRRRFARAPGVCVVSQRAIRRGDAVFSPAERPARANASAMISVEAFGLFDLASREYQWTRDLRRMTHRP
ncbi:MULTISPECIES: DUF3331 domain-containing protein [Paraburkholderia]|uniref:DUF3331 domain-containing protein n=1 Tax=Paraburkholderia youngii TaxID=2782701 RepID=A0ABX2NQQ6_9BURK|nr:DUF3331 domain-containing protein [Paraburkholderia youngii]NUX52619.1 DUF3331 domain-containing protein [Paraburkholderia youngii]NVI06786.1 DUF3331 domain-containing protein [Paraburkholderia youngii]